MYLQKVEGKLKRLEGHGLFEGWYESISNVCVALFVHCLPYSWIPKEHPPMLLHPKSAHHKQQQQPTSNKQQPTTVPRIPNDSISYSLSISLMNVTFLITVKGPLEPQLAERANDAAFFGATSFTIHDVAFPVAIAFGARRSMRGTYWGDDGLRVHRSMLERQIIKDMKTCCCPSMWFSLDGCGPIFIRFQVKK